MQFVPDRFQSVTVRSKFCGAERTNLRSAVCQDIVTGGRPLAALAGEYRFECTVCGNRRRTCPAASANALSSGDVSHFAELVVKSLHKSHNARVVPPAELAEFASVFAAQGRVDHIAAVARAMPLTFAPHAQRAFRRFPPELPPAPMVAFKMATAGLNTEQFAAVKSIDLTAESNSDSDDSDSAGGSAGAQYLAVDEHILAQRTAGWTHWLTTGRLDHRGHGWQRKLAYAIHHASVLPLEICWHMSGFFIDSNN